MNRKRYGIVLPEPVYKELRLKAVEAGMSVGDYVTQELRIRGVSGDAVWVMSNTEYKEASVEEPVKKELDIERAKPVNGQLRKGLGPLPGESRDQTIRDFRPVPKPGAKKK